LSGQQLGGSAGFEWAEDGLRCTITLAPRFARHSAPKPAPAAANSAPAPSPAMQAGSPRVLVVEDEALLAMELERTLHEMGCSVVGPARTLGEAVRLAAGTAELRAAVLDVNLGEGQMSFPAMDLLETRGVPYVIATGYGSAGSLQGRDRGAAAVLRKPYAREELVAALGRALAARRGAEP
jgi:CheY-like chemotaxis protein